MHKMCEQSHIHVCVAQSYESFDTETKGQVINS